MDYRKIHNAIINRALCRQDMNGYTEKHHVIPKSMGGSNDKYNLVVLTAREHYIIHWLLFKIYKNKEMAFAWHRMTHGRKNIKRYTSHSFAYANRARAIYMSELFTGKKLNESHKLKLRMAKLGKKYEDIGRARSPLKGRELSESHKNKLSITNSGRNHTEEAKLKCSVSKLGGKNPMFGKKTDRTVAEKISAALIGRDMPHKRVLNKSNKSGVVGVSYNHARGKWVASIYANGKANALGRFNDFNDAVLARKKAESIYLG